MSQPAFKRSQKRMQIKTLRLFMESFHTMVARIQNHEPQTFRSADAHARQWKVERNARMWASALRFMERLKPSQPTFSLSRFPTFPFPLLPLFMLLALFTLSTAHARINVVTLPGRDSVQLTIYNSVDLTLVKETRLLTFRKGLNRLEFSWANTLIDPTSVEFRALTHADGVDVLDVSFPPRVTNTLEWRINSDFAGEVQVEIRYFTSGINWSADYVAEASKTEKLMGLAGHVRVNNNSGEDYENAQVRLVVGGIRLVENSANLARAGAREDAKKLPMVQLLDSKSKDRSQIFAGMAAAGAVADAQPRAIVKEGLSEYFLYTVEGRDTIQNGWSKRLPSFRAADVPIISYYKYERERWGEQVLRTYRFTNDPPSKLGAEPLPDGEVKAFRFVSDDQLYSFLGRTAVKYIPVNEQVDLELGNDREVMVKPTIMN